MTYEIADEIKDDPVRLVLILRPSEAKALQRAWECSASWRDIKPGGVDLGVSLDQALRAVYERKA